MYTQGSIQNFWCNYHTTLHYQNTAFTNLDDVSAWTTQGFTKFNFTCQLYDMSNPTPQWAIPFLNCFKGINVGLSFFKMDTNKILPYHSDYYRRYIAINGITDPSKISRVVVFLEDWQPGHIFEINNTPITQWKAGDYVLWNYNTPHMAANLGLHPRYTAQITFTNV